VPSSSRSAAPPSDAPETVLKMRVTKDGKPIGTDNDGTVKKAGVGIFEPVGPVLNVMS